ncbi:glycosyltransferase family 2 protein [Erythrobacteraceae bacterium CFH 75059]|uniref:glycosyltransferase family A protein n=1 Tax=Qipengyuania thermophila TaxID=2509361 RepID=UPI00101F1ED1|nr:glycosyltransferase family 2 protein [Qipengyuania thermophila]TCD06749.1 glycosyltransferase family 2 protein [Erythrobacteraceae bacterium CFH 75059]
MLVTVAILARNEGGSIGPMIADLARQTLFAAPHRFEVLVYANDCSDDTAERARAALRASFGAEGAVRHRVIVTPESGKNRAWNTVVHDVASADTDVFVFCDADITFARVDAIAELLHLLGANPQARAVTGYMIKDLHAKPRKTVLDRLSLGLSSDARLPNALNGSLYALSAAEARKIWLPVPLPGEDGFLSAMIKTNGFTEPNREERVISPVQPTHYYEAHTLAGYFRHEKRVALGTVMLGWIIEELWSLKLTSHAGALIREWNQETPDWIARLIRRRMGQRRWVVPSRLLFQRLDPLRRMPPGRAVVRFPLAVAASVLNLVPVVTANRELKNAQAAAFW